MSKRAESKIKHLETKEYGSKSEYPKKVENVPEAWAGKMSDVMREVIPSLYDSI